MNPEAADFPPPKVSVLPLIGDLPARRVSDPYPPSVFDDGTNLFLRNGRTAIALCLQSIGVRPGDEVLLPSYHCASMVEPILWAQATPVFFRVDPQLHADLNDIEAALRRRPRALLLTHYFGVSQSLREVVRMCRDRGVILIEDCAHAYFGSTDLAQPIGSVGDFAIASLPKFFPTTNGGLLRINSDQPHARLPWRRGLRAELRAFLEPHERAVRHGRGGLVSRLLAAFATQRVAMTKARVRAKGRADPSTPPSVAPDTTFRYLQPSDIARPGALWTQWLWQRADRGALVDARRRNWRALADALSELDGATLLEQTLPANAVPYKLALLIDYEKKCFSELKRRAVPLWRWEDLAMSSCAVANDFRLRLLHVPCHQSLSERDIDWMIEQFKAVFRQRRSNPSSPARVPPPVEV